MTTLESYIKKKLKEKNLTRRQLVELMGYKNIPSGMNNLEKFMCDYKFNEFIIKNLPIALDITKDEYNDIIRKVIQEIDDAKVKRAKERDEYSRKHFRPLIYIKTSQERANQIFIIAICGIELFKHIQIPDEVLSDKMEVQIDYVKQEIVKHYQGNEGRCSQFGLITGYIYFWNYDEGIEFDINGELIKASVGRSYDGEYSMSIDGKSISSGLAKKIFGVVE